MFWGLFFLLLGVSIILKIFLRVDIPFFKILFGGFLIYWGIQFLIGSVPFGRDEDDEHAAVFSKRDFKFEDLNETPAENHGRSGDRNVSVVFGSSVIDLTTAKPTDSAVDVNVVFGEAVILLDSKMPLKIKGNSAFAELRMPDGNMVAFGTLGYRSPGADKTAPLLTLHGNVAFGSLKFILKD